MNSDTRNRSPWDFPDCPDCGRHIYVDKSRLDAEDWHCHKCGHWSESN